MCAHTPPCPTAEAPDREAARHAAHHPEQGWSLLCNGVLFFEDTRELLPDGQVIAPRRPVLAGAPSRHCGGDGPSSADPPA
ncbi:DUF5999 family protein [Streptomyces liangshanensis]|uniref:DUF5999 family protein n=1 Tax=Streptomyces liangshanensis TaxID=2717324 RepID=UPI0036DC92E5